MVQFTEFIQVRENLENLENLGNGYRFEKVWEKVGKSKKSRKVRENLEKSRKMEKKSLKSGKSQDFFFHIVLGTFFLFVCCSSTAAIERVSAKGNFLFQVDIKKESLVAQKVVEIIFL